MHPKATIVLIAHCAVHKWSIVRVCITCGCIVHTATYAIDIVIQIESGAHNAIAYGHTVW